MILLPLMILLKPIAPERALFFKAVRLRALADSPTSFSGTYAREGQLSDEEWIRRSERWSGDQAIGYLAFDTSNESEACGLIACYAEEKDGVRSGHVISMWVDPGYRRAGVGAMLIDALKTWARACGLRQLVLMVTSVNQGAMEFYRRIGFQMTGKTGPYPNDPAIVEYQMRAPLED